MIIKNRPIVRNYLWEIEDAAEASNLDMLNELIEDAENDAELTESETALIVREAEYTLETINTNINAF